MLTPEQIARDIIKAHMATGDLDGPIGCWKQLKDSIAAALREQMNANLLPLANNRAFHISETLNFQLERIARGKSITVDQLIKHCLERVVVLVSGTNESEL